MTDSYCDSEKATKDAEWLAGSTADNAERNLARAYLELRSAVRHTNDWADQAIADLYEYRARFEFLFHALPFEVRHRWGGDVQEFLEGIDAARGKATT